MSNFSENDKTYLKQPKVGLAMSGAAARSVFYIGFLESLQEQGIEIETIAASSGASLVAACFAVGKLEQFKRDIHVMDRKFIFSLLNRSKIGGGWYSLDTFEDYFREHYTLGKTLEDVRPRLMFMATDLDKGEQVVLSMGDIAHAARISCTVPGAFEPVKWGNRTLVDGGLVNYLPGHVVRESGVDLVIGVHVQATKHIFLKNHLIARGLYNQLKRYLGIYRLERLIQKIAPTVNRTGFWDYFEDLQLIESTNEQNNGMFSVLGRSLDLAIEASTKSSNADPNFGCDYIASAIIGNFYSSFDIASTKHLYQGGRDAGKKHGKNIKRLINAKAKELYERRVS